MEVPSELTRRREHRLGSGLVGGHVHVLSNMSPWRPPTTLSGFKTKKCSLDLTLSQGILSRYLRLLYPWARTRKTYESHWFSRLDDALAITKALIQVCAWQRTGAYVPPFAIVRCANQLRYELKEQSGDRLFPSSFYPVTGRCVSTRWSDRLLGIADLTTTCLRKVEI